MNCNICPKNCNINRENNKGFCGETNTLNIARAALHHFEEPVISGSIGSGAVFFCGCNLKCVYCQNYDISNTINNGTTVLATDLPNIFNNLIKQGAHNINLVTPTHYSNLLSEILEQKFSVPIVWNSSGYEKKETLQKLNQKVQVYLPDFKYADNNLAKSLSGAEDYFEVFKTALEEMLYQTGKPVIENGLIKKGVIVRHLVLPGFLENSKKVIDYISQFKDELLFSLMFQYVPIKQMEIASLNRRVKRAEYNEILDYLYKKGIENGFVQSLSSASTKYIPSFNLEGLK